MTLRQSKTPRINYTPRTPAQEAAWRAFRLRAVWSQVGLLSPARATAARHLIDAELTDMGFQSEGDRQAARRAKWEAEDAAETEFEEVPF